MMKRILGVDYGTARTGVAVSDELGMLAHPVETITKGDVVKRIAQLAKERDVETIVVGVPRHMNGEIGESAARALEVAEKLRACCSCNIVTLDERLTTLAAARVLRDSGRSVKKSRDVVDQVAAQMILQSYLDRLSA